MLNSSVDRTGIIMFFPDIGATDSHPARLAIFAPHYD